MYGKVVLKSEIRVLTGMHIGGSSVFSAIGAVDQVVARDPYTQLPIIPGSSLKGKLRSLLSRSLSGRERRDFTEDPEEIKHLFGCHNPVILSRLQFADCFVTKESQEAFQHIDYTEIKWENAINRITAIANPRQIERVLPGIRFACRIAYTVEDETTVKEDFQILARGMKLLQMDYLGGHGTRGSGRICFEKIEIADPDQILGEERRTDLESIFKDVESYDLLSI